MRLAHRAVSKLSLLEMDRQECLSYGIAGSLALRQRALLKLSNTTGARLTFRETVKYKGA